MLYLVNYLDFFLNLGMNKVNIFNNVYKFYYDWFEVVFLVFGSILDWLSLFFFDGVLVFFFVFIVLFIVLWILFGRCLVVFLLVILFVLL